VREIPEFCPVCNAPLLKAMNKASAIVHLRICEANRGEGIVAQGDGGIPCYQSFSRADAVKESDYGSKEPLLIWCFPRDSPTATPSRSSNVDSGNKSMEELPAAVAEVLTVQHDHHDDGDELKVDEKLFSME
jgi:hypothetical protein